MPARPRRGRACRSTGRSSPAARRASSPELEEAIEAAERAAFAISPEIGAELIEALEARRRARAERRRAVASEASGSHALTVAMRAISAGRRSSSARSRSRGEGARSAASKQELLEYLAGQAVVSIENANLHETVERQAVTDELTGLANTRAFFSAPRRELERNRRFGTRWGW